MDLSKTIKHTPSTMWILFTAKGSRALDELDAICND
jgi:hypothetical protein